MRVSNNLVTRQNQAHSEVWHLLLCFLYYLVNNRKLFQQRHSLLLFVENASSGVPQLNDEDVLCETRLNVGLEEDFEEWLVLAKTTDSCEFVLEVLPNFVRLISCTLCIRLEDLSPETVIVAILVDFKVSHLYAGHVSVFVLHVGEHLEQAFSLVIMSFFVFG